MTPAPPLPVAAPVSTFDPLSTIADHDGSVVVYQANGRVIFENADAATAVVSSGSEGELRVVSADGGLAALFERTSSTSRITVIDRVSGEDATRIYELPGLVEPEAFSTDGSILYVIDHQIAAVPGAYRVRPLDLATGRLDSILGPSKVPLTEDMNGRGRRQVWSPDGTRLYTLYIRQTHHHHAASQGHTHGEPGTDAFVHVLDLDDEWAFCLDLPAAFGGGDLATTAMAVSPDGSTIAVADHSAGQIAFASTVDLAVTTTMPLPKIAIDGDLQIGLTDDRLVLGSGTRAYWFDRRTMKPVGKPVVFATTLTGFTSSGSTVFAWTTDMSNGPKPITSP